MGRLEYQEQQLIVESTVGACMDIARRLHEHYKAAHTTSEAQAEYLEGFVESLIDSLATIEPDPDGAGWTKEADK